MHTIRTKTQDSRRSISTATATRSRLGGAKIFRDRCVCLCRTQTLEAARKENMPVKIHLLVPVRTDTSYFHEYIYPYCKIHFIKGRLKFIDLTGYNERLIETETDGSDPSWSSLLSK